MDFARRRGGRGENLKTVFGFKPKEYLDSVYLRDPRVSA